MAFLQQLKLPSGSVAIFKTKPIVVQDGGKTPIPLLFGRSKFPKNTVFVNEWLENSASGTKAVTKKICPSCVCLHCGSTRRRIPCDRRLATRNIVNKPNVRTIFNCQRQRIPQRSVFEEKVCVPTLFYFLTALSRCIYPH